MGRAQGGGEDYLDIGLRLQLERTWRRRLETPHKCRQNAARAARQSTPPWHHRHPVVGGNAPGVPEVGSLGDGQNLRDGLEGTAFKVEPPASHLELLNPAPKTASGRAEGAPGGRAHGAEGIRSGVSAAFRKRLSTRQPRTPPSTALGRCTEVMSVTMEALAAPGDEAELARDPKMAPLGASPLSAAVTPVASEHDVVAAKDSMTEMVFDMSKMSLSTGSPRLAKALQSCRCCAPRLRLGWSPMRVLTCTPWCARDTLWDSGGDAYCGAVSVGVLRTLSPPSSHEHAPYIPPPNSPLTVELADEFDALLGIKTLPSVSAPVSPTGDGEGGGGGDDTGAGARARAAQHGPPVDFEKV